MAHKKTWLKTLRNKMPSAKVSGGFLSLVSGIGALVFSTFAVILGIVAIIGSLLSLYADYNNEKKLNGGEKQNE